MRFIEPFSINDSLPPQVASRLVDQEANRLAGE